MVADCVRYAAEHPVRDLYAGGGGRQMALSQKLSPRQVDAVLGRIGIPAARTNRPDPGGSAGNLYASRGEDRAEGDIKRHGRRSLYTWSRLHPPAALGLAAGLTLVPAALYRALRTARG